MKTPIGHYPFSCLKFAASLLKAAIFYSRSTVLLWGLLIVCSRLLLSQEAQIPFRYFNVQDGMSEASANCMIQDPQGYIWIGTQNGLLKYDGYKFKVFLPREGDTSDRYPVMHAVQSMALDKDGKIWLGSGWDGGLACLDPATEKFTNYFTETIDSLGLRRRVLGQIFPDSRGDIWMLTEVRQIQLARLRPSTGEIRLYGHSTVTDRYMATVPTKPPSGIAEDSQGNIWMLTRDTLYRYVPEQDVFESILTTAGSAPGSSDILFSIRADEKDRLWISGNKGISIYDLQKESLSFYPFEGAGPAFAGATHVYETYEDRRGNIWLETHGGPVRFKDGIFEIEPQWDFTPQSGVRPLVEDENGVWLVHISISPRDQLHFAYYRHDQQRFSLYDRQFNLPQNKRIANPLATALIDQSGLLWLGSQWGGIHREDPARKRIQSYGYEAGDPFSLPNDVVRTLLEDRSGNIWVGTGKGLARFMPERQAFDRFLPEGDQSPGGQHYIYDLCEDQRGQLWIGAGNGLFLFDQKRQKLQIIPLNLDKDYPVRKVYGDREGKLWCALTGYGVVCLDTESRKIVEKYRHDPQDATGLVSDEIYLIHQDARNNLWFASYSEGATALDGKTKVLRNFTPTLNSGPTDFTHEVTCMEEDSRGNIWLGSGGLGVIRYDYEADAFTHYYNSVNRSEIQAIIEDRQGRLWFAAYVMGLHRYDPQTDEWTVFTEEDGLLFNNIATRAKMILDDQNRLWLPSERGLTIFDTDSYATTHYRAADGFRAASGADAIFTTLYTRSGDIWIGNDNGLNFIQADRLQPDTTLPQVWITGLSIFEQAYTNADGTPLGHAISKERELNLSYNQNDLTFEFVGLHYLRPEENQYRWMLENYDEQWSTPSRDRQARYTNLSPGTYIFRVQAANADGVWNEEGASLRIVIAPPWWQTMAFRGLLLALLLAGLYFFLRWRTNALQKQNQELEEKIHRRTGELRKRVDELQTVNQVSRAAASELELNKLIQLIGEEMRKNFNAPVAYVALLDKESRMINFPYLHGIQLNSLRLGEGLTSRILLTGEPLLINEDVAAAYERFGIKTVTTQPTESYLGVPIPVGEEHIGVISVSRTEANRPFDEEDQRLLSTLAATAGSAIRNARLYQEAQAAKAAADRANEAKSSFLSTVSHELRTPLTSILGFAKIVKKRLDDRILPALQSNDPSVQKAVGQVTKNLDVITSEGERLTQLINDVLDLAKIEAGKIEWHMEPVRIEEVFERAMHSTQSLFDQKQLLLEQEIEADLPGFTADRNRLIQVLINLLSNAVKFTQKGKVTCKAYREQDTLIVSVADTGVGIAPADQPLVFEKFKQVGDTLTDKPQGTGLGLPICKEIIEYHGGRMWLESELGRGSTFCFALPLAAGAAAGLHPLQLESLVRQLQEQLQLAPVNNNGRGRSILVVDDDSPIRSLLRQELSEAGYAVREAANGREAVESVRKEKPDLILLDVMMPEMNGYDVAAVLKNDPETMDIPIIILSILQDRERGMRIGVDRYLTKPIDTEKLFREVGALLEQGHSQRKVMVVDENVSTIKTLAEVLQARGYHVVEANGKELMEKALATRPDIIILNARLSEQQEMVKTLRFERGLENVLFLVYE